MGAVLTASQIEEDNRSNAMAYLQGLTHRLEGEPDQWRCEVVVARSVAQGIVDFAKREEVNLIAMYTHNRKGLAKLVKKSIARDVQRRAPIEVKMLGPAELATVA